MNPIQSLIEYFRSSKSELEKVSWPSREQTVRYSAIVLSVSVLVGIFFAGLDFGLSSIVDAALKGRTSMVSEPTPEPITPTVEVSAPEQPGVTITTTTNPLFAPSENTTPTP